MPDYRLATRRAASQFGVDPGILLRLIRQESGFNPNARSSAGAQGIAQFMPATARAYGVNLSDNRVTDDLQGAARYLRANLDKYGSYTKALSVYNSGRPEGYKSIPETANYVRSILSGRSPSVPSRSPGTTSISAEVPQAGSSFDPGPQSVSTLAGLIGQQAQPPVQVPQAPHAVIQSPVVNAQPTDSGIGGLLDAIKTPAQGLPALAPTSQGSVTVKGTVPTADANPTVQAFKTEAQKINNAKVPYQWGGGHTARAARSGAVTPLDCSGAVSRVLGINPRVSGQFQAWGAPGAGKRVTIYANPKHVLMEIDGHFFGTSGTNPGGGAGWIPRSAISRQYLSQFTARHPPGQ